MEIDEAIRIVVKIHTRRDHRAPDDPTQFELEPSANPELYGGETNCGVSREMWIEAWRILRQQAGEMP